MRFISVLAASLFLAIVAVLPPATAQDADSRSPVGQAFVVAGIEVDLSADTDAEARDAAFRMAPREAWPRLWARLTGASAENAPRMSDAALSAIIDGIEIESERFGNGRYIARLGVAFNRQRAGRRLPASARIVRSEPLLLIPVLSEAGADATFDPDSPWLQAWAELASGSSVIDYIRPPGTAGDRLLLNAWQAKRGDRRTWRQVLPRYQAQNVATAEARLRRTYPGGPISALFIARYGPDAIELERFTMRAASSGELVEMLGDAVKRMDGAYARALERGLIGSEREVDTTLAAIREPEIEIDDGFEALGPVAMTLATPTPQSWSDAEARILRLRRAEGLTLSSLQIGGRSEIRLDWRGTEAELRSALFGAGFLVNGSDGSYALTRRAEDDVAEDLPEPAPTPAQEPEAETVEDEDDA